jgi:2-polyprenyl-6-hydroxyphenyl methylase/3-demethylubiquinone-9 3-methyltransferase
MSLTPSEFDRKIVNNDYYHSLGRKWYSAQDDPVALLRAESKIRNAWVLEELLLQDISSQPVLDIGCGGGFLSNFLAAHDVPVTGIDLSKESLEVAHQFDTSGRVQYLVADAYELPFKNQSFAAVTCMDFLEHVSRPGWVVQEAARVLQPGGIFFFHTFNRNWLSWLIVIKGVEWFIKNTPEHLHVKEMFIKPHELAHSMASVGLQIGRLRGLRPTINSSFWKMLKTGQIDDDFKFQWTSSTWMSYTGWAQKIAKLEPAPLI